MQQKKRGQCDDDNNNNNYIQKNIPDNTKQPDCVIENS